ncbi:glycosyltransferase family 2 protein [Moraxella bovoculi]|uniref:glycosyltransferase family 2 protein n=1 Tax=Moraxella bovoculi TaxID=386891 RepID=UPI0009BC3E02|nr:glycosyltransferase family 2 protein [Moraxella bovoculi]
MAYQVANYPAVLRYKTPKSYWQAMRLGLYQTVLNNTSIIQTRKSFITKKIAQLKRFVISDEYLQIEIWQILSNDDSKKYHKEFIKETFYLYPKIFVEYFLNHRECLSDQYYLGLVLSYANDNNILEDFKSECDEFFKNFDTIDKQCLYANIYLNANDKKITQLNHILSEYQLLSLSLNNDCFCVNCLSSNIDKTQEHSSKVSVIVTAYNAQNTIKTCIQSLLNQTYANLEIIIINDHSDDDTLSIIQALARQDGRIRWVDLPRNTGTFVAKSIGVMYATGEFLTCQDADDFAHPQKIAIQVEPLLKNEHLVATTSYWLRIDNNGNFYARQYYPFLRQNPASPLFRRQKIQNEIGLWHIARTGADSEFWARLKLHYGNDKLLPIKQPLTFASHRKESLMNSDKFGVHNRQSALTRLDYWENWQLWHIDCLTKKQPLKMPDIQEQTIQKIFEIPHSLVVDIDDIRYNLKYHKADKAI